MSDEGNDRNDWAGALVAIVAIIAVLYLCSCGFGMWHR